MRHFFIGLFALSVLACGGEADSVRGAGLPGTAGQVGGAGAAGASGASGKAGAGVGGASGGGPCAKDDETPAKGAVCLESVSGTLVDLEGKPVAGKLVTVCGVGCFYGKSAADGSWNTPISVRLLPREYVVFAHGGPTHANLLVELDADLAGPIAMLASPVRIPALPTDGPLLPADDGPGGDVTSGTLTLSLQKATKVELDIEDLALGEPGRRFRAVRVGGADLPPFAKTMGASFAIAIAPAAAVLSLPASLSIEGAGGLSPGQKVEFFIQEDDFLGDPSIIGSGRVVATGSVSADGARITTVPGAGLTKLNWLGVRPAP